MAAHAGADCLHRRIVEIPGAALETFTVGPAAPDTPVVCAAHPAVVYGEGTAGLVAELSGGRAVAINPRGIGLSSPADFRPHGQVLAAMADDLEAVRRSLGVGRWTFWGMSGGAWLAVVYAVRHPASLAGIVLESGCDCFRTLLADPASLLSPFHPSWRPTLETAGLIEATSHAESGDPDATEWRDVDGVPPVFCRRGGPALCVSAVPATPEVRQGMPLLWSIDVRPWLPKIRTKALVVAGGADRITPVPRVRALHETIAGSRWMVVEGGGHVPMTARPAAIANALRSFVK